MERKEFYTKTEVDKMLYQMRLELIDFITKTKAEKNDETVSEEGDSDAE